MRSKQYPDKPASIIHVIPSLTTFAKLNPSFRVYEMDAETFELLDYEQYRLYVESEAPEWQVAYRFTQFYSVPTMRPDSFVGIVERLKTDQALLNSTARMLYAEGPLGDELLAKGDVARKYIICRLSSSDVTEFNACAGWGFISMEHFYGYMLIANLATPDWEHAHYSG